MSLDPQIPRPNATPWHQREAAEALAAFRSTETGLTSPEAARRLRIQGPNQLLEGRPNRVFPILLRQFESIIIWILIFAGVAAALVGNATDAFAILAIVVLNAAIGFFQEYHAEKSIATLQKLTAPQSRVRRDGSNHHVAATEIVVGDVLVLEAGSLVPADARLLDAHSLRCVESALTGESAAVSKQSRILPPGEVPLGDRTNMVFVGTSVVGGTGHAVVVATGMRTELGQIAGMITEAGSDPGTPLQQRLNSFGRVLLWATLVIVALLFGLGLLRKEEPKELFLTAISLAVAAVPEGLPAVVTVALSLGVLRMSRRHALIRKLASVETLGSTSVICTDKTGTLTLGNMTVRILEVDGQAYQVTGEGYGVDGQIQQSGEPINAAQHEPVRELARTILAGNDAKIVEEGGVRLAQGDPTECALLVAATKAGVQQQRLEHDWPRQAEFPFDSERKRSSIVRQLGAGRWRVFVNGAPGPLLTRCTRIYTAAGPRPLTNQDRKQILARVSSLAAQTLRVLGSAQRDLNGPLPAAPSAESVERDLMYVGLSAMHDPPRPEARDAIAACRAAGIRVVMITGDHPDTARAIARDLGLAADSDLALSGAELDSYSEERLRQDAPRTAVYARVTAGHKLRIVRALQATGAVVAMAGDGINDAPAIQGADIGIAMGRTGSEVTKQAADMILTDDNLATVLAAVEEGRGVYANIRKTLQYLLAGSTSELLFMASCVMIGLPTPLLPIHLLWVNLVTDGLPALCLAADPVDSDVMKRGPRPREERITTPRFLRTMLLTGLLTAGVSFAVYVQALKTGTVAEARTAAFTVLVFAELFRAFGARSSTKPLWRMTPAFSRPLLLVMALSFSLQVLSQHSALVGRFLQTTPVSWDDCLRFVAWGLVPLGVLEVVKVIRHSFRSKIS